jgi:hypothetical protein
MHLVILAGAYQKVPRKSELFDRLGYSSVEGQASGTKEQEGGVEAWKRMAEGRLEGDRTEERRFL